MPHRDSQIPLGAEVFETGVALSDPDGEMKKADESPEVVVGRMIEEAIQWRRENLDPKMEEATDYYMGEPFGNEEEGRSQVVDTTVRDVVQGILPSLMRIFFGPDEVVEFAPDHPEQVDLAEQMTNGVNWAIKENNRGFVTFYSMLKDALVRKLGIVKYWWEDKVKVLGSEHQNLTADEIRFLQMEVPNVDIEFVNEEDEEELIEAQGETFDVIVRRVEDSGQVRIEAVPPEEFIFSPSSRSKEDARLIGHVREMPASELVAMGVSRKQVTQHLGSNQYDTGEEMMEAARRVDGQGRIEREDVQMRATRDVPFAEVYVDLDLDGDGIAEMYRIWCIGENWEWAVDERGEPLRTMVDEAPFALFTPDLEPHTIVGLSAADYVMDLQEIRSSITRGMLDSLTQHLRPMTEIVEGEVNQADVLNPEVGRVVRVKKPGMMREVPTDFVGGDALPVLEYMDQMKEDRTGMSKAAAGLDADALQSSTKAAVAATLSASQQRIELIARIFAETGLKDLFNGVARLMVENQDRERMIRVNGEFVPMDPRSWDLNMDVTVQVGLGSGMMEERLQVLSMLADKQEALLQNGAPIVGFREYRNTLSRMVELAGFENATEFFKPFGQKEEQAFQEAQARAAEEPTEAERLEKVEMAKIAQRREQAQMDALLKARNMVLEDDRKRDEIVRDYDAKLKELGVEVDQMHLEALRDALDRDLEEQKASADLLEKFANIQIGEGQA